MPLGEARPLSNRMRRGEVEKRWLQTTNISETDTKNPLFGNVTNQNTKHEQPLHPLRAARFPGNNEANIGRTP